MLSGKRARSFGRHKEKIKMTAEASIIICYLYYSARPHRRTVLIYSATFILKLVRQPLNEPPRKRQQLLVS